MFNKDEQQSSTVMPLIENESVKNNLWAFILLFCTLQKAAIGVVQGRKIVLLHFLHIHLRLWHHKTRT